MDGDFKQLKLQTKFSPSALLDKYYRTTSLFALENTLGWLVRFLSIALFVGVNLYGFSQGEFVIRQFIENTDLDGYTVILSVSFSLVAYSSYLLRDKDKYQTLNQKNLVDLRAKRSEKADGNGFQQKVYKIEDYCSSNAIQLFGKFLLRNQEAGMSGKYFAVSLLEVLIKDPGNQAILKRLGLDESEQRILLKKYTEIKPLWNDIKLEQYTEAAFVLAMQYDFNYVDGRAFLITLLKMELVDTLRGLGVDEANLQALAVWVHSYNFRVNLVGEILNNRVLKILPATNAAMTSVYAPTIEQYTEDLTFNAHQLLYAVDRKSRFQITTRLDVLQQVKDALVASEGLCLLIGESGVGKTTVVETFALLAVANQLPNELKDRRVLRLNTTKMLAGIKESQDITAILQNIFKEQEKSGNMILVIEDLDQLVNLEPDLQKEVIGVMASELQKVPVKLLATITPQNYQRYVSNVGELAALFKNIEIKEATKEMTLQIIMDELPYLENQNHIKVEYTAITRICELAPNYEFAKRMPDKALDLLEEVMQVGKERGEKYIKEKFVDDVLGEKLGLRFGVGGGELDSEEKKLLMNLDSEIRKYLVGQSEAVNDVAASLRRARAGLNKDNKPVAAFLFYGPTGVGKTELSRTVAKIYFGDEHLLHRMDMSEFQSIDSIDRLIGFQEGNQFNEGLLTQFVLQHPYSVILLDELEKAHSKVLDIFLQVLDNAKITDGSGRSVDFSNTIIVATSNAGSNAIFKLVGEGKTYREIKPLAFAELQKSFRVEFLNRFDGVIMFHPLTIVDAEKIAKMLLFSEKEALKQKGIEFVFTDKLVQRLVKEGFDQQFGARSLKRKINEIISDRVANALISGDLKPGDIFSLE